MKARIKIRDVGGLRGEHAYELSSGNVWLLRGSNSGGKSSFVRGLAAILSMPEDGDLGKFAEVEARTLGIKTEDRDPREGFVNLHSDVAEVSLSQNGKTSKYVVTQGGKFKELPVGGDPRFLLAGILSNESKILRQLKNVDSYSEPDDFKWAVNELSYASRYDEIEDTFSGKLDDVENRLVVSRRRLETFEILTSRKRELEDKEGDVRSELDGIKVKHKGLEKQFDKQEKLNEEISNLVDTTSTLEGSVSAVHRELEAARKKEEKMAKEINKKKKEMSRIQLDALRKDTDKKEREIEEQVSGLIEERASLDGILNLLVTASSGIGKTTKTEVKCPLCEKGSFSPTSLKKRLGKIEKEKEDYNRRIADLNLEKRRMLQSLEKREDELSDLKGDLAQLYDDQNSTRDSIEARSSSISGDLDKIEKYKERIADAKRKMRDLSEELGPEHKEVKDLLDKYQNEFEAVLKEVGEVNRGIEETSMELMGKVMKPGVAIEVLNDWKSYLEECIDYCRRRAEEQRQMAASEFNKNVESMMKTLGFKEFRTIMLDKNYRLYVERLDPKTKKYKAQQAKTLSTSEKLSIALILQIALKETYIPDVPFFIVDDIMEDLDDERKEVLMKYLADKAKEKDWCVLVTKLVDGLKKPELAAAS
ncbi:MAG: hypothetical protein KAW09_04930 [Thermoplasmata archaeon]|nr:hypothetical protein [Thermoplasmata archaeon]